MKIVDLTKNHKRQHLLRIYLGAGCCANALTCIISFNSQCGPVRKEDVCTPILCGFRDVKVLGSERSEGSGTPI